MTRTIYGRPHGLGFAHLLAVAAVVGVQGPALAQAQTQTGNKSLHTFEFVVLHETPADLAGVPGKATDTTNAPGVYCHFKPGTLVPLGKDTSDVVAFKPAALDLKACGRERAAPAATDVISVVQFVAVQAKTCPKEIDSPWGIDVKVEKRQTLLEAGLRKVIKFAGAKLETVMVTGGASDQAAVKPFLWCAKRDTTVVQHNRATVTLSVRSSEATDKDAKPAASASVITGTAEHWFLAGDGLVDSAKTLKWDSATRTLKSDKAPEQLYLSANYMWGDLYGSYKPYDVNRMALKFMVLPSRKPFDSVGLGLGYRVAEGSFRSSADATPASDGGFMVFAGVFWTRADGIDAAGNRTDGSRERSVRVGVSYSLDTLLGWLGK